MRAAASEIGAGSSPDSSENAIQNAISRASQTLHDLRWFEVLETRGQIEAGQVAHYQVVVKVGFSREAARRIDFVGLNSFRFTETRFRPSPPPVHP